MSDYISPFAVELPYLPPVSGVRLGVACSGMRYKKRNDMLLVEFAEGTQVAGIFTKSTIVGAPVMWCKRILATQTARGLIVNAGISNVFTGDEGLALVEDTAHHVAALFGVRQEEIYVSSTGIIGELPDKEKLMGSLPTLYHKLKPEQWKEAARAIITTDTFAKAVSVTATIGATEVVINGIIKGSGMIEPNMATMLGYVFTDATIPAPILQELLQRDAMVSYNAITVDSDTSTSDTVLVFATGQKEHWEITSADVPELTDFREKLRYVHQTLAQLVVADGEGISKFITVNVLGAATNESAHIMAKSIANSPLVKTAIAGEDANWGRIVAAAGKCGEPTNQAKTSVWFGDMQIADNGRKSSTYREEEGTRYVQGKYITITIDVGVAEGKATVWTCDLTHEYIAINADYRS